ncbi:MAG: CXXX repeat peptide maturase [Paludibacteraceae bacterium]
MKPYLQYLVVLLDNTSIAYCHAENPLQERKLIPIDTLRQAILFGMKQNLMLQFVYPDYELPQEYNELIESIDHVKIGRDVIVCNRVEELPVSNVNTIVLRLTINDFITNVQTIVSHLAYFKRLNITLTDIESFTDDLIPAYKEALSVLADAIAAQYKVRNQLQVNILTDRLQLTEMRNCDAGIGNITLAPNGKFYLCPAFYYDEQMDISNRMNYKIKDATRSVGDLQHGIQIPNKQLLQLDHAPLCRICDAYHCHRCIWLNQRLTWDNNTPSRQQCLIAHVERNATQHLQAELQTIGYQFEKQIENITYLDPFEVRNEI